MSRNSHVPAQNLNHYKRSNDPPHLLAAVATSIRKATTTLHLNLKGPDAPIVLFSSSSMPSEASVVCWVSLFVFVP